MSEIKEFDIWVIGAGASGCLAAINAKRQNRMLNLCLIEKGNKILQCCRSPGKSIHMQTSETHSRLLFLPALFYRLILLFFVCTALCHLCLRLIVVNNLPILIYLASVTKRSYSIPVPVQHIPDTLYTV